MSKKAKLNEPSDVNISFTTPIKSGEMEVDINFDKNLNVIGEAYDKVTFALSPNQKEYNLNFRVTSSKNGLYYIRLLTKVWSKFKLSKLTCIATFDNSCCIFAL